MTWLSSLLAKVFAMVAGIFSLRQWGKSAANKEQAEKIAEEKVEDAKIASGGFIDRPADVMRRKK